MLYKFYWANAGALTADGEGCRLDHILKAPIVVHEYSAAGQPAADLIKGLGVQERLGAR
jgi:hypothetical protein